MRGEEGIFGGQPQTYPGGDGFDRKQENQQNGRMKTTLDLPGELVREIKLHAVHEGRKLKDAVADLLRKGLAADAAAGRPRVRRVKLPLIECRHEANLTPDQVADLLMRQETQWHHDTAGH